MINSFSKNLTSLRKERKLSQREVSRALNLSQALLSHYENGLREPGLEFVVAACDYYSVSADFLLGRTLSQKSTAVDIDAIPNALDEKDNKLTSSFKALLRKRLAISALSAFFDLIAGFKNQRLVSLVSEYFDLCFYRIFRLVFNNNPKTEMQFKTSFKLSSPLCEANIKLLETSILKELENKNYPFDFEDTSFLSETHTKSMLVVLQTSDDNLIKKSEI